LDKKSVKWKGRERKEKREGRVTGKPLEGGRSGKKFNLGEKNPSPGERDTQSQVKLEQGKGVIG